MFSRVCQIYLKNKNENQKSKQTNKIEMRKCGNCNKPGHNRRTCNDPYGSRQPVLRSGARVVAKPVVQTRYNCPGINGVGSHTVYVLESDSTLSFIKDKQSMRGGAAGGYHCPKHGCFMPRA